MMHHTSRFLCAHLFLTLSFFLLGTEATANYSRRTPIVEAVHKTRASIVTVRIPKSRYRSRDTVGTGVIIDERGYIITNRHVVGKRDSVEVTLYGGKEHTAQVVLADPNHDLAILFVKTQKLLPALRLGPGGDLMVGERVIAVGHPYGYQNTVSQGIISALGREITMPTGETLRGLVQHTAGINPGNSGGPLLNINSELIGINVALRDGAENIAFAINANTVRSWLTKNLSALKISGVHHGLACREKILSETGDRQRVVVSTVHKETPAANAGLKSGDMILAVENHKVKNEFDLERFLWGRRPGQKVRLKVIRNGEELNMRLTLGSSSGYANVRSPIANPIRSRTVGKGSPTNFER